MPSAVKRKGEAHAGERPAKVGGRGTQDEPLVLDDDSHSHPGGDVNSRGRSDNGRVAAAAAAKLWPERGVAVNEARGARAGAHPSSPPEEVAAVEVGADEREAMDKSVDASREESCGGEAGSEAEEGEGKGDASHAAGSAAASDAPPRARAEGEGGEGGASLVAEARRGAHAADESSTEGLVDEQPEVAFHVTPEMKAKCTERLAQILLLTARERKEQSEARERLRMDYMRQVHQKTLECGAQPHTSKLGKAYACPPAGNGMSRAFSKEERELSQRMPPAAHRAPPPTIVRATAAVSSSKLVHALAHSALSFHRPESAPAAEHWRCSSLPHSQEMGGDSPRDLPPHRGAAHPSPVVAGSVGAAQGSARSSQAQLARRVSHKFRGGHVFQSPPALGGCSKGLGGYTAFSMRDGLSDNSLRRGGGFGGGISRGKGASSSASLGSLHANSLSAWAAGAPALRGSPGCMNSMLLGGMSGLGMPAMHGAPHADGSMLDVSPSDAMLRMRSRGFADPEMYVQGPLVSHGYHAHAFAPETPCKQSIMAPEGVRVKTSCTHVAIAYHIFRQQYRMKLGGARPAAAQGVAAAAVERRPAEGKRPAQEPTADLPARGDGRKAVEPQAEEGKGAPPHAPCGVRPADEAMMAKRPMKAEQ
ncbi:hypothetical protein AB1Y20_006355 [Prymnesium parvum]|uniref:Uncharacterized protein n=1 Tax=Prymnesium parvum TaxID=97485 RepID=A0AB34J312_PRYPA